MMSENKFGLIKAIFYVCTPVIVRGISSFGRALAWHARGDRFDSGILHSKKKAIVG
jgi:hypothetical protein